MVMWQPWRPSVNLPAGCFAAVQGVAAALVAEVEAGQMLYIPAGWFHEVTSYAASASPTHLALNYWYHPPDNLRQHGGSGGGPSTWEQPYK